MEGTEHRPKDNTKYVQCYLQYDSGGVELVWIPLEFAKKNRKVRIGKDKKTAKPAVVLDTFMDVRLTREKIEVNRYHPLRDVTDV